MALTVVAVVAAFAPSAFATITDTASTVYGSDVPGAHTDYTIIQNFTYDSNGAEPTAATTGQDLKKWVVDSPAGLAGNPNAIPEADRCDPASFDPSPAPAAAYNTFFTGSCPDSAQVGVAQVYLVNDAQSGTCPNANPIICLTAGLPMYALPDASTSCPGLPPYAAPPGAACPMLGKIYLLKSSPEVPTTLGTLFTSKSYQNFDFSAYGGNVCTTAPGTPCAIQPKTKSILAPVTNESAANNGDSDFRIRTVPADYSNPPSALLPTAYGHAPLSSGGTPLHISRIDQHLFGMVDPNETPGDTTDDVPFLSMPARCDSWDSYAYAIAWNGGGGSLSMDPNNTGGVDSTYVKSAADSKTPNCSTLPPLNSTATSTLSTGDRGAYPGMTVKVGDPSPIGHDQVKKLVMTLPEAVSVNVNALNNVCSTADRDAATCPDAAQIGTATIANPFISAGLTGKVYMVKSSNPGLPNLSIFADGAIKFRLDATTQFVGPKFNIIETTFDNLPQTPFSDFTVNITGGSSTSSLLFNRSCPTDGSAPPSGSTAFSLTGYTGTAASSNSANTFAGCYGAPTVKVISQCIKQSKQLKVTPTGLIDEPGIAKIQLLTGHKKTSMNSRATDKASPFKFKYTLKKSKYKKGAKWYYGYKVTYKDGHITKSKQRPFKICK